VQGFAFLLALALLTGCGAGGGGMIADDGGRPSRGADPAPASSTTAAQAAVSRQLIMKFKPHTVACDPAGIAQLSLATRVSLEFVRTMSGGACVVKQSADSADDLSKGQETLEKNPAVEYVEPDAVMKAL